MRCYKCDKTLNPSDTYKKTINTRVGKGITRKTVFACSEHGSIKIPICDKCSGMPTERDKGELTRCRGGDGNIQKLCSDCAFPDAQTVAKQSRAYIHAHVLGRSFGAC